MEHISSNLQIRETETPNGLANANKSLEPYLRGTERNKVYLANCIELVDKTIRLANQPPLDTHDSVRRAAEWHDALEPNIPLERLPEVFTKALSTHASTFPINAFEMLSAWNQIRSEYAERMRKQREENPVLFCDMKVNHINEHGDVEIALGGVKEVVVPCQFCRRNAYDVRIAEELQKFRDERGNVDEVALADSPQEIILGRFAEARAKYLASKKERPRAKSAIGIMLQAKLNGGDDGILSNAIAHVRRSKMEQV